MQRIKKLRVPAKKLGRGNDKVKTGLVKATGWLMRSEKSPDEVYGQLFADVQHAKVYDDGKTFVDLVPQGRLSAIKKEYELARHDPNFDLREFVSRHFYEFAPHKAAGEYVPDSHASITEHISELWDVLRRRNRRARGSLLALPHHYIVPGGRFNEQFYWDSYFIMLGLAVDNRWGDIEAMMMNYTHMFRKIGFIPTANRSYFLSRSQPPFFASMVRLLASRGRPTATMAEYLPYMLMEYRFWMKGESKLKKTEHRAYSRLVEPDSGVRLNRYYDNKVTPRPESMWEDVQTADATSSRPADRLYLHLRAGAESGWDFSSRWFDDPSDISSIHTADILPVDLNCLLYTLEDTIAETYSRIKNPLLARKFRRLAERRKAAIQRYFWNEREQFFCDYNFHHKQHTPRLTLAAVFPLWAGVATQKQADAVAARTERDFLQAGGLVTTLEHSGQQWDWPNGWAPLQWIAIQGLRRYGHDELADEVKKRWVGVNLAVFDTQRKLIEKYDVVGESGIGGGGEYPLQDGFGWTNGVLLALLRE